MENTSFTIRTQSRRRPAMIISLGVALAFCLSSFASAQNEPAGSVAADQSSASGAIFIAAPVGNFNPLTASDAELAQFGFPPRPDQSKPELYARWARMVASPQERRTDLQVQATNLVAGKAKQVTQGPKAGANATGTSENWSGYAIYAPSGTFTANDSFIIGEWEVPVAQQAFGVCNGQWDYSVQWIGFDGWGSNNVLQAGSEADAYCSGGSTETYYSLWYEWWTYGCTQNSATEPCNMFRTGLATNPGDVVGVEVWYTISAPQGHALIVNYTTQKSASLAFYQPASSAGVRYAGDSADWIVERPGVNGVLPDLTNYVAVPFLYDYAYNGTSYFFPGSSPSNTTIYSITMTCPPWSPSSACTYPGLSYANLEGIYGLWFDDEGIAY